MHITKCRVCTGEFIHYPWTDKHNPVHWECRPCDHCGRPAKGRRGIRILRTAITDRRIYESDCAPWDCYCLLDISMVERTHYTTETFAHWLLSEEKRIELIQIAFMYNCFLDKVRLINHIRFTEEFERFLPGDDLLFMGRIISTLRSGLPQIVLLK